MIATLPVAGTALAVAGAATVLTSAGLERWARLRSAALPAGRGLARKIGQVLFCVGMALLVDPLIARVLWAVCGIGIVFLAANERREA